VKTIVVFQRFLNIGTNLIRTGDHWYGKLSSKIDLAAWGYCENRADLQPSIQRVGTEDNIRPVLRIRIRSDPYFFAGSESGSDCFPTDPYPDPGSFHCHRK